MINIYFLEKIQSKVFFASDTKNARNLNDKEIIILRIVGIKFYVILIRCPLQINWKD